MAFDLLGAVMVPFLFVTIIAYFIVFNKQFSTLDNETNRLVILATRLALFLPLYAILIYISLLVPVAYLALEVPTALIEGYSFYTFFVLLVTNFGGPVETVNLLKNSPKKLLFYCCCPADKSVFYNKATWNLFHFLFTRVIVVFFSVICAYIDTKIAHVVSLLLSLVALVQLIFGVASVVNLYEDLYAHTLNLNGVLKVLLLKISVGLITIQGIIVELMIQFDANPYESNDQFSAEDRLMRNYCALVLIEFTVMAFVYYFAFGGKITMPSTSYAAYMKSRGPEGSGHAENPTKWWFLMQVLSFRDVFGLIAPEDEQRILNGSNKDSSMHDKL